MKTAKHILFFLLLISGLSTNAKSIGTDSLKVILEKAELRDSIYLQNLFLESVRDPNKSELARIYSLWAGYLDENHKYDSAEKLFLKSSTIYESLDDKAGLAAAKMKLAEFYRNEDNRAKSLKLSHEAYDLFVELKDSTNIYFSLSMIGINHDYLGHHDIALEYYNECVKIASAIGREISVACMYHNMGGIYSDEDDFQLALDYYDKSKQITEKLNDIDLLASIYQGLCLTYIRMELFSEAYMNLKKEYYYALLNDKPRGIAFAYQDHGSYFLQTEQYDSSIYYSKKALELALKLNNAQITSNAYGYLKEAHYQIGDYKNAYDFYTREMAMDDSLYTIENDHLIQSIKTEFETEKKERELAQKNLELQSADFALNRQKNLQWILFLALGSLFVILFIIYRGYLSRKKANDLLSKKNSEIEAQNEQIRAINEMKSRWFINVAHELRTPLTLIRGPIQRILNNENLSPDAEEDLTMVSRNTQGLVKLVNEILDLAKLENGEMTLNTQVIKINELVRQTISVYELRARQLGVSIEWKEVEDVYLKVDQEKISKILVNLISNALKFTGNRGKIKIDFQFDEDVRLSVSDTGAGIPEEDVPHVFDRFFQSANAKNAGGTGVGLSLCKEIAELHGGSIEVKSELGSGTTFTLKLPKALLANSDEVYVPVQIEAALEDNFISTNLLSRLSEKPSLLIVEDNSDMRKYVASLLKPYFEIKEAVNGAEGLKQLEAHEIKMIISDMMMPVMDGVTFSKKVKTNDDWKMIPFIHLSALSDNTERKVALRVGVDDFLQKPFDPEELIIRVQNLYQNSLSRLEIVPEADEQVSFEDKLLKKLKDEVVENVADPHFSVIRLADCAAMSERQIYRYLKNATGMTPLNFIQEIKLNMAMELAQKKVYLSSSELASAVGFQQSPYFSSLFEKRFGKKPSAYLKAG